ncbi:hypothetical protein [Micromonospora sp. NPDC005087]
MTQPLLPSVLSSSHWSGWMLPSSAIAIAEGESQLWLEHWLVEYG